MKKPQIYVSFDAGQDRELYENLVAQSRKPISSFAVSGGSERTITVDDVTENVRRKIRDADQMIVICGEATETCTRIGEELRIAKEEGTPHFLVWGRREVMCTKPQGSASSEGIFSWTRQVIEDQIALTIRNAHADALAEALRTAKRATQTDAPKADAAAS